MAKRKHRRPAAELEADRRRTGRPPKAVADRQSEPIMVYLTKAERKRLGDMAAEQGVSISALIMQPWRDKEGG